MTEITPIHIAIVDKDIAEFLAPGIAAGGAVEAAFLVDQHVAAFRALAGKVLGQAVIGKFGLIVLLPADVLLQYAGDGIPAGENRLAFLPGNGRATDAAKLLYHGCNFNARPQSQRDKPTVTFKLG